MDPLTHGIVGAAASQSAAGKEKLRPAAAAGFAAAVLADLDYFIHLPSDPLFNIEVHRQFTHSLIFIPAGALVATVLLWWFMKKHLSFKELYIFSFLGYATAGILDTFTSYGTQLIWPFMDTRIAWNLISVVDPVVTTGLIIFVALAFIRRDKMLGRAAICWLVLFLLFGWLQNNRATEAAAALADNRGHEVEELVVKPTIGNQRLWRANYIYDERIYTDAVRTGIFSGIRIYEGTSEPRVIVERDFPEYRSTVLYDDLMRFKHLSDDFLIHHPQKPEIIGDARYSMLPTSMIPLWGVKVDRSAPDKHLPFLYFRDAGDEIRKEFWDMLMGRDV